MTNTSRNTLVLSILLIIFAGLGFALTHSNQKKANLLKAENIEMEKKIAVLESQISNIDSLMAEYELRKAMVAEQSKLILGEDTPTITYQYLLKLLTWMDRNVIYDFAMSDKGKKETTWNAYVVSGRTNYLNLVEFTKNIEHQRALLTIEDLSIGSDGIANSDTVSFSMILRTHIAEGGLSLRELTPKKIDTRVTKYQLFRSRVWDSQINKDEIDPRLVNLDSSKLIGISDSRVFLRDNQGIIRIINLKDRVLGGYLYSIDVREGTALFKIDKYGIPENQVMNLNKE